jgi:hypothetical protein
MRKISSQQKAPFPQQDVITKAVPSPTDGWDALSPLALMDPKRAPILDNWVPRPGWVELRAGYNVWSTVSSTAVETILIWRGPGSEKMFAAANGHIYDVTTQYSSTSVVSGLTSNRWQWVDFTPALGSTYLVLANGSDRLREYNGTSWLTEGTDFNITGLPNALNSTSIRSVFAQKRRLWFLLNNGTGQGTSIAAFMPTDAVSGAIGGSLDLGALWTKGGYLQAMANWTIDGGAGPQDYAAFISSKGQVSIYQGTDPTSVNTWSLVGTFDLPPPIGDRCATRVGSDVGLITLQGVLPLSSALPFDPSADRSVAITSRIQNQMSSWANSYSGNFGWQLISFPLQQLLFLNVPTATNSMAVQGVMNALTGAWCRFTGWNANCFEVFNNNLYWGDSKGNVNQGYIGTSDLFNTINADMQCAFNYFDDPGRVKRATMVQPLLTASGNITPFMGVDYDFITSTVAAPISTFSGGSLWDVAKWDVDKWPSGSVNIISWLSVEAIGHALAIRMKINFSGGITTMNGVFDLGTFDNATFDGGLSTQNPTLQINAFNLILEMGGYV